MTQDTLPAAAPAPSRGVCLALLAAIIGTFAVRALQVVRLNINWDEFHYLSHVYDYLRGDLSFAWASFHVHLFGWLPHLDGHEVDQILAARWLMLALGVVTAFFIYRIARRFLPADSALFAVLSYVSFSYVMEHGASFRPDPIAACLFVIVVHLLLPLAGPEPSPRASSRPIWTAVLAGLAMALSLMVTIKAVIHLAVIGGVLLVLWSSGKLQRRDVVRGAVFAGSLMVIFTTLYLAHRSSLQLTPTEAQPAANFAASIATTLFNTGQWFPQYEFWMRSVRANPLVWLMLFVGAALCLRQLSSRPQRATALVMLLLASPLLTLLIYRNGYPYFYGFILPLAMVLCGVAFDALMRQARAGASKVLYLLLAVLIASIFSGPLSDLGRLQRNQIAVQRQLLDAVHKIFPEPVPYIDRCSMVSSYPQAGFFMSKWGMENYRAGQTRSLTASVREDQPPFIVGNIKMLNLLLPESVAEGFERPLLAEDRDLLMNHYIHHWGHILVAGKHLAVREPQLEIDVSIAIGGLYTLEGKETVWINGVEVAPGGVIQLDVGSHRLRAEGDANLSLRWGDRLYRPEKQPLLHELFIGFGGSKKKK